jgi:hypothetical protein
VTERFHFQSKPLLCLRLPYWQRCLVTVAQSDEKANPAGDLRTIGRIGQGRLTSCALRAPLVLDLSWSGSAADCILRQEFYAFPNEHVWYVSLASSVVVDPCYLLERHWCDPPKQEDRFSNSWHCELWNEPRGGRGQARAHSAGRGQARAPIIYAHVHRFQMSNSQIRDLKLKALHS